MVSGEIIEIEIDQPEPILANTQAASVQCQADDSNAGPGVLGANAIELKDSGAGASNGSKDGDVVASPSIDKDIAASPAALQVSDNIGSPVVTETPEPQPSATAIRGCFERLNGKVITGWAFDPHNPSVAVELMIHVDGVSSGNAKANVFRRDLLKAGIGSGHHGFEVTVPDAALDGARHMIELFTAKHASVLKAGRITVEFPVAEASISPSTRSDRRTPSTSPTGPLRDGDASPMPAPAAVKRKTRPIRGNLESIDGSSLKGWAFDPLHPDAAVELFVMVDGVVAGLIVANTYRADLSRAGVGSGEHGFEGQLPGAALDGKTHAIEIIAIEAGSVLNNGSFGFSYSIEGTAYLKPQAATVSGWAQNVKNVRVAFEDGQEVVAPVNWPVVAFGPGKNIGFSVPIPANLLDGTRHTAMVTCADTGRSFDGNPITFHLTGPKLDIEIVSITGDRVVGVIENLHVERRAPEIMVVVDGRDFVKVPTDRLRASSLPCVDVRTAREFSVRLPPNARQIAFRNASTPELPALGAWQIEGTAAVRIRAAVDLHEDWSADTLSSAETTAGAKAAFLRFAQAPGTDFDASWYSLTYPQVVEEMTQGGFRDELSHYVGCGAKAGLSPSGFFSEEEARRVLPFVEQAIASGSLDSAFSLYLYLGGGDAFDPVPGFPAQDYVRDHSLGADRNPLEEARRIGLPKPGDAPRLKEATSLVSLLPRPLHERSAETSIYASWMARIALPDEARRVIAADEMAYRRFVGATTLTRAPLVSVIMPTFNRAYTIAEAVQSVLDQSYLNWELIICDDGSTDKTSLVVSQFDDTRIRYMQFEKSNGAATRNKGLRFARGEYLAYLDSDNMWDPLFLDVMIRSLLNEPGQPIAYCGYIDTEIVGTKVNFEKIAKTEFSSIMLSNRNFMDLNTIVHHRKLHDWIGGFDEQLPRLQDYDLALRYTSVFPPIFVRYCLAFYRRNIAWGQVTHVAHHPDVPGLVARKTGMRTDLSHVRLKIDWDDQKLALTVVAHGAGNIASAASFAELASPFAHVTLVVPAGSVDATASAFDIIELPETTFDNVSRLSYLVAHLPPAEAVVGFGLNKADVNRLCREKYHGFAAEIDEHGVVLNGAVGDHLKFHLGTLPMTGPRAFPATGQLAFDDTSKIATLFTQGETGAAISKALQAANPKTKWDFLIAPKDLFSGRWGLLQQGQFAWLEEDASTVLNVARRMSSVVAVPVAMESLSLSGFTFVIDRLGAGVITMVRPMGFGKMLIDARAAFDIGPLQYGHIINNVLKVENAKDARSRVGKNAIKSYRISMHPELTQQRIAGFLYQVSHESLVPEVHHVA